MGNQTRRGFLAISGSDHLRPALIGCAAGAPPNSTYQGTYRSRLRHSRREARPGTFNYSVDQKGRVTGSLVDSGSSGKVWSFNGTVEQQR